MVVTDPQRSHAATGLCPFLQNLITFGMAAGAYVVGCRGGAFNGDESTTKAR
jgi:hypothetical protein